jgi:hypothetical protein
MQKRYVRKMVFVGGKYRGWGLLDTRSWITPNWVRHDDGLVFYTDDDNIDYYENLLNNRPLG